MAGDEGPAGRVGSAAGPPGPVPAPQGLDTPVWTSVSMRVKAGLTDRLFASMSAPASSGDNDHNHRQTRDWMRPSTLAHALLCAPQGGR